MLTTADLDFFSTVARSPSLAAAARELDVTPSAVTQRLQELERRLGVRLVDRSGRHIALTDEGELLASRGRALADDIAELTETLSARGGAVAGHLRVVAPFGFGRAYVAPVVASFQQEHPAVTIDLMLSDRRGKVTDHSWDVAVHIGELPESSFVTRPLAANDRVLCAAPSYLARHGTPDAPRDLLTHRCIALRENDEDVTLWRFGRRGAPAVQVRIEPVLASNDGDVVRAWALSGEGIIVRSEWSIADDLRAGRLVRLLDAYTLPDAPVVALVGPRKGRSARTTAFVRALQQALTPVPWRAETPS
ncbi:MAG TPA: LysR family transcriptional regulator [Gemmatimonas sp.]|uniref:LysR family transcriptional regulator n=1 Tax=Gemmatimonas sp. TaxID=1962908 RepID=UPI002ED773FE